ncbi:MAG: hypothetical protein WCB04_04070 [Mycobacteriales bacterium]
MPNDLKSAIPVMARAYLDERSLAIRTADSARLRALATPDCPCQAFADRIDADWHRGRVDAPNFYAIERLGVVILTSKTTGHVTVFYRSHGYRVIDAQGRVLVNVPPDSKTESTVVHVGKFGSAWRVFRVVNIVY